MVFSLAFVCLCKKKQRWCNETVLDSGTTTDLESVPSKLQLQVSCCKQAPTSWLTAELVGGDSQNKMAASGHSNRRRSMPIGGKDFFFVFVFHYAFWEKVKTYRTMKCNFVGGVNAWPVIFIIDILFQHQSHRFEIFPFLCLKLGFCSAAENRDMVAIFVWVSGPHP